MAEALYQVLSCHYDRIYHFKDYAGESERLCEILRQAGIADGSVVVEAACGTGSYLACLQDRYDVAGFDLHEEMLAVARRKLPEVPLFQADLRGFELPRPADAILCLFSSIAYLPPAQLGAAAAAFYANLRPGGVALVEPFVEPDAFEPGQAVLQIYEGSDVKLARAVVPRRDGRRAILDFHWLIATPNAQVEHFEERHVLWLQTAGELLAALSGAGFEARFEPGRAAGRGLLVAQRPAVS